MTRLPDASLSWVRLHPRPDLLRLIARLHEEEARPALRLANVEAMLELRRKRVREMGERG